MEQRKITIKHASGVHILMVKDEDFEKYCHKITDIIKGKNKYFKYKHDDGSVLILPFKFLRESSVMFESQKTDIQLLS
jgi:UDP-galactopyranose mutase